MSSEPAGELNEHRIEAQGARFDGALDDQVRQALERSQVLDAGAAPEDSGKLLQAAMRVKNLRRLREEEEGRLRELEAQVRAEALATVKLRKQAAELAGVEARAQNIARVRAETVARLAELEQRIRDDARATVALRQEIARRQAQAAAQPAPSSLALPPAAEPAPPAQPALAPVAATGGLPAAAPALRRTGAAYLAWSGWGVAMLLAAWWGSRGMMPAAVPAASPPAAPATAMHASPAVTPGGEPIFALKLETELHTPPH